MSYTVERVVVLSDIHVPYEDKICQALVLRFLQEFKPTKLIINGDLLDFHQISSFDREPSRRMHLTDDIVLAQDYLKQLVANVPETTEKIFLGGNHCDRLRKYLWRSAPELTQIAGNDIPSLLNLQGWNYIPYYNAAAVNNGVPGYNLDNVLLITHGICARKYSGYTARAHFERFHTSGVCGHVHRLGQHYFRAYGGVWTWIEGGCLCQLEPPYAPSPDWQQGFVAGYVWLDGTPTPHFDLQQVFIRDKKIAWQGRLFKAS